MMHKGLEELIKTIFEKLKTLPKLEPMESEILDYDERDTSSFECRMLDENVYEVSGGLINELCRKLILTEDESLQFAQKKLKEAGVIKALKKLGLKNGDTIVLGNTEFDYTE